MSQSPLPVAPTGFKHRRLVAALVQAAVILPATGAALLLAPTPSRAQNNNAASTNTSTTTTNTATTKPKPLATTAQATPSTTPATPIDQTSTGTLGATGDFTSGNGNGGAGGAGNTLTQTITGKGATNDPTKPAALMSSTGGAGGTGGDNASTSGSGGAGGNGGAVSLTVDANTTVSNGSSSSPVITLSSQGGAGGNPGNLLQEHGAPGKAGNGGNAGALTLQMNAGANVTATQAWSGNTPGTTAVTLKTVGGAGAAPGGQAHGYDDTTGQTGANGGNGGGVQATFTQTTLSSKGAALLVLTQGGTGGDGEQGTADVGKGKGGNGGAGGSGGNIDAVIGTAGASTITAVGGSSAASGATIPVSDDGATVAQASFVAAGVQLQSLGAGGGAGGSGDGTVGEAGAGGAAGSGGNVGALVVSTTVKTTGFAAAGVVAQSVGGSGGDGPDAGGAFAKKGGNGGLGGNAGTVTLQLDDPTKAAYISTTGADSIAAIAQSIGGGGGMGGSVQVGSFIAGVGIGGSGEKGGDASAVSLFNGTAASGSTPGLAGLVIKTQGEHSSALIAQSIGGGGGAGGSAMSTVLGPFAYSVGGSGGTGGDAGTPGTTQVTLLNESILSTAGNHAKGMIAQAVGGGGGDGGGASAMTASAQLNITTAVGGSGGTGGSAGDVTTTNDGQVITAGSDAWGLLAQSVGGGGGNGGMSKAVALQAFMDAGPVPAVNLNVSVGGSGGSGGASGNSSATNTGLVFTGGANAHGVFAQSVSGGGGNGGDASAISLGAGQGTSIDVTVAVGGNGGVGSNGGNASATNAAGALVWTLGDGARGVFVQSIGGGGGTGGTGKDDTTFLSKGAAQGSTFNIAAGGNGQGGGNGGTATATNDGNILILGDSADGVFAQSVGGGGGKGGEASSVGSGGANRKNVKLGGASYNAARGGSESNGGNVNVANTGAVLTYGADSAGIYAQSVGGGGGKAGTSTKVLGATSLLSPQDFLKSSSAPGNLQTYADGVLGWAADAWKSYTVADLVSLASEYQSANAGQIQPDSSAGTNASSTTTVVAGGGTSNTGDAAPWGDGGTVTVTNSGRVATNGPASSGIWAQSVGGGGGQAGATDIEDAAKTAAPKYDGQVTAGGTGYNAGKGGDVSVTNTALVTTTGDLSYGILAQSVAGGGGHSTITNSADSTTAGHTTLYLGGQKFATGDGGAVMVSSSQTQTQGNDAIGVLAQSIGGGGGVVALMHPTAGPNGTTTSGTNPGIDPTGSLVTLQVNSTTGGGGANDPLCDGEYVAACGKGGAVTVNVDSVSTQGRNAHGVLAQSIGAGGGLVQGVTLPNSNPFTVDQGNVVGEAGTVTVGVSGVVTTAGDGAYGVLAQSIGGGGVLAGDLAAQGTGGAAGFTQINDTKRLGYGGDVLVNIAAQAAVITNGANAPAVFAQSLGGGGGLVATSAGLMMGALGGAANAGTIKIENAGLIQASGSGSSAIVTDSEGTNRYSQVGIDNLATGSIRGNASAAAILLAGEGNTNGNGRVTNDGIIDNVDGTAVMAAGVTAATPSKNYAVVTNDATGGIFGNLMLGSAGILNNSGTWATGNSSIVGTVSNQAGGLIQVGSLTGSTFSTSQLTGDLASAGTIATKVDFAGNQASVLKVSGKATLASGNVSVTPTSLSPNAVAVLTAGTLSVSSQVTAVNAANNAVAMQVVDQGNTLAIKPVSQFGAYALSQGYSSTQRSIGAALDSGFTAGMSNNMAQVYTTLANMDPVRLKQAVSSLGNEGVQVAGNAALLASHAFVERMNSCPQFDARGMQTSERDCAWVRAIGSNAKRSSDGSAVGYQGENYVLQAGGQKGIGQGWFVGGSVAYDQSHLSTDASSVQGRGYSVGIVVKRQVGDWTFSGAIDAGRSHYDSSRTVTLAGYDTALGSFNGSHVGVHGRIARQIAMSEGDNGFYLKPYLDLHATQLHTDGYKEAGGGLLALNVAGSTNTVFAFAPMLETGKRFELPRGVMARAYLGAGAAFYSSRGWGASASFANAAAGAGAFTSTSELPRTRAKLSAGVDLYTSRGFDMRLEYSGEFATHYISTTAAVKLSWAY